MAMMISKFHKIIQSKIVWTAFAVLISVAFVGVYTGSKGSNQQARAQQENELAGRLYGEGITRSDFGKAKHYVFVNYSIMMGRQLSMNDEISELIDKAAWQRLATLKKAEQMGLSVTGEQVVQSIKRLPLFANRQTGQFDKNEYDAFISSFLPSVRMTAKNFESMMTENVLIQKATQSAAQGALVTEDEIKERFHLQSDLTTVEYALLPRSLAGTPEVTEDDVQRYFNQNPKEFYMPETVLVNYVSFPVANFTADIPVADEMVAQVYENNKQRYLKPTAEEAPADAAPEYQPLEEVKESITEMITTELARRKAFDAADTFVAQLADSATAFDSAATAAGLTIENTPAFALTDTVKGIDPTAPFARAAFALENDETHYYSDPVSGRDVVYVISLIKKQPTFPLAFSLVKDDAKEAATLGAIEQAYLVNTEKLHSEAKTTLATATSFADLVAQNGLELELLEPFNANTQSEGEFAYAIMGASFMFEAGSLIDLIPAGDEFILAYVSAKEPADEATTLPAIREELAESIHREKSGRMASAWQESLLVEADFEDLRKSES